MVINGDDSWKFANYPVVEQLKTARKYFNDNVN